MQGDPSTMTRRFDIFDRDRRRLLAGAAVVALVPTFTLSLGARQQPATPPPAAATRPNVLFVVFDDLNDWTGPTKGHPQAHTPTLDSARRARHQLHERALPGAALQPVARQLPDRPAADRRPASTPSSRGQAALANYPQLRDHVTLPATSPSRATAPSPSARSSTTLEPQ